MSHTTITTIPSTIEEYNGSGSGELYELDENFGSVVIGQVIYLSCVAVIGTIANLIVMIRGLRYKNGLTSSCSLHRSATMDTTNLLVISLAVSNLGTSTFSVGIFIFPLYVPNTPINDFTCRFIWPMRELFIAVACYAFTLIAVGRFLILFRSFRNIKVFSFPIVNNVALWLVCYLLFAVPFAAAYTPYDLDGTWVCDTHWEKPEAQRAYVTFVVLFNSFVPTFLVSVSYIGIIRHLKKARNRITPVITENIPENQELLSIALLSLRAAKISFLLLLSFLVTILPYGILSLSIEYNDLDADTFPQLETLHAIAFCLAHTGALIDPLIIMLSSRAYRPNCALFKIMFSR